MLTVNYNGVTRFYPFTVPTGQLAIISTMLDTTAPVVPVGANYTAATGTQTGRIVSVFRLQDVTLRKLIQVQSVLLRGDTMLTPLQTLRLRQFA